MDHTTTRSQRMQSHAHYHPRVSMHGTDHGLKTFYTHQRAPLPHPIRTDARLEDSTPNSTNIAAQARALRHSPAEIGLKSPYRPKSWDTIHAEIRQQCLSEQQQPDAALNLGRSWQEEILNHNQTKVILRMESQRRKAAELIAWDAGRARVECARALAERTKGYMTHHQCRDLLAKEEKRRAKLEEELQQARGELVRLQVYILASQPLRLLTLRNQERKVLLTESSGKDRQIKVLKQKLAVHAKSSGEASAASAVESASEDGNMMDTEG